MSAVEVVFKDVLIVDGSGQPGWRGSLGVSAGRICGLGPGYCPDAAEVLAGEGLALAPGFIDVHTHDDLAALRINGLWPKLTQGVTSVVTGNCGLSLAPGLPAWLAGEPPPPLNLLGERAEFAYPSFAAYLAALRAVTPQANVLPLVGHSLLRLAAMDSVSRPASPRERAVMMSLLEQALAEGAAGMSTGLAYPLACYAETGELLTLLRVLAAAGGLWTTHMRDERAGVVAAVAETIDLCRRSGVRTLISHHKCCGRTAFGLSASTLAMIADAVDEGLPLSLDTYPYTASSTMLASTFARDSERVQIGWSEPHPDCAGEDLVVVAARWGVSEDEAVRRLSPGSGIYHQMCEADLQRILRYPDTVIGSDGMPRDRRPHPRLWGTFPRVLGHYVRERRWFDLATAVAKMTGRTAALLGLADRGRLEVGARADLVLFDPAQIADRATYEDPVQPSAGIRRVYVNGRLAVRDGVPTGHRAGHILKST
jgi:N-acyl-D-amino-acid deacylase